MIKYEVFMNMKIPNPENLVLTMFRNVGKLIEEFSLQHINADDDPKTVKRKIKVLTAGIRPPELKGFRRSALSILVRINHSIRI